MIKSKLLIVGTAVAGVLLASTAVGATGNYHGHHECREDEQEVTALWDKGDKEYKGKEYSQGHKKHHKKCDEKPKVCEYNKDLPKDSPDCVKPEEPNQPETPTVPEQPVTPTVAPAPTPAPAPVVQDQPLVDFQGK